VQWLQVPSQIYADNVRELQTNKSRGLNYSNLIVMRVLENVIFINVQYAKQMYHFTLCAFVGLNYSNGIVMHRMENVKNLKECKT
jgi:hypothetical protein